MSWKAVGFLSTLLIASLLAVYAFQWHRQQRAQMLVRASTSSIPLFFDVARPKSLPVLAAECVSVPKSLHAVGPAMTISQMDAKARGHESNWQVLRQRAMPGDVVREYKTETLGAPAGGYLLLRGSCLLGQVATWSAFALD